MIIGSGGAGKSTLAQKLGKILNLPVYHLDTYFWKPGWIQRDRSEFIEIVYSLLKNDKWIIDGNYRFTMDLRIEACDTIIFLDYKRYICYWNILKRHFTYKGKSRPCMTEGCHEKIDWVYVKWIWSYQKRKHKVILKLEANKEHKNILVFKNRKDTDNYLDEIKKNYC
jgi:adenylate kinase family enzyme